MSPAEIEAEFWMRSLNPTQRQIDALVKQLGIPVLSLAHDFDGGGVAMGMLRVERGGNTFEFSDDEAAPQVCGFVAWDRADEAKDIVGWSPRDGWVGSWLGRAALIGEHQLDQPRLGEPLRVFLDLGAWLQASREGVAIVKRREAWRALQGFQVLAANVAEGAELRKLLTAPKPRIMVATSTESAAA